MNYKSEKDFYYYRKKYISLDQNRLISYSEDSFKKNSENLVKFCQKLMSAQMDIMISQP